MFLMMIPFQITARPDHKGQKVLNIVHSPLRNVQSARVQFGRAMKPEDINDYQQTIQAALSALDKKDLTLILHGASFPSAGGEDTGIGSPNSKGAKALVRFIRQMGFNSVQLGPGGKTKGVDPSPYTSTSFSSNPLFIDLAPLVEDSRWGSLVSRDAFDALVANNPNRDKGRVAYGYVYPAQENLLTQAYRNFKAKRASLDSLPASEAGVIRDLDRKFSEFKTKNRDWLEKDSLYEAFTALHGNDYFPNWPNELDRRLFSPRNEQEKAVASARIAEVKAQQADVIEGYEFVQFIADDQKRDMKAFSDGQNVKMLADRQVAFSDRDVWAYQDIFLDGYSLGAPPDYFSKTGQAWGFPVIDPAKLFNPDGTVGEGGKALQTLFTKIFRENRGGVRIDHIIGLVDPWIYLKGRQPKWEEGAGRLYSSPEYTELNRYARIRTENLDDRFKPDDEERVKDLTEAQVERYCEVLRLIIQAAESQGLGKDAIICEDLGTLTTPVKAVMKKLGLSGVRVTQFVDPAKEMHMYRGKNVEPEHWIMPGTHDNESLVSWVETLYQKNQVQPHAAFLSEDLSAPGASEDVKNAFLQQLLQDPKAFIKAKFVELFASPSRHIQIFFPDFFGMKETYNKPGTSGDQNWSLRVPNGFERAYYDSLTRNEGVNLPEILLMAMQAKGSAFLSPHQAVVSKLERYREILKAQETPVIA